MMLRRQLDDYLDGALASGEAGVVAAAVAKDPAARSLLEQMKRERAVRAAAFESYAPTPAETASVVARFRAMAEDEATAPVGRIGTAPWIRWIAGVAAALAVLAGTFAVGRMTASPTQELVALPQVKTEYSVVTIDTWGETQVHTFASLDERQSFITDYLSKGNGLAVADLTNDSHM